MTDSGDDDPVLVMPDGRARDAWREDYPYNCKLGRKAYEKDKRALQIELLKFQHWVKERNERLVILFGGRNTTRQRQRPRPVPSPRGAAGVHSDHLPSGARRLRDR
ncbi:hypothetical protein ACWC9U_03485 [Streptomyces sp. 900116325]